MPAAPRRRAVRIARDVAVFAFAAFAVASASPVFAETTDPKPVRRTFLLSQSDYPLESRNLGEQGRVVFDLAINADGKVIECRILQSSGFERLDEKGCQIALLRWRFEPAKQDSAPVAGRSTQELTWALAGRKSPAPQFSGVGRTYHLVDGKIAAVQAGQVAD